MMLLCRCQVLTASNTFILGYLLCTHHAHTSSNQFLHILTTSKKIASHAYRVFNAPFLSLKILRHMLFCQQLVIMTKLKLSLSRKLRAYPVRSGSLPVSAFSFVPSKDGPVHQAVPAVLEGEQVAVEILNFRGSKCIVA